MSLARTPDGRCPVEMVIPLKWSDGLADNVAEMAVYLNQISRSVAGITVVDGNSASTREERRRAWGSVARVIPPDSCLVDQEFGGWSHPRQTAGSSQLNGKVVGALTGIHASRQELVILADDDVRHTSESVTRLVSALATADLVRPVNVYDSWPWHAQWDGARSLLNVVLGTDWPGTFALRRSTILGCGGWSTDVLFENLELWRTVKTLGGRVIDVGHLVVARRAPDLRQFWGQRVRQAYDDLAQPARCPLPRMSAAKSCQCGVRAARPLGRRLEGRHLLGRTDHPRAGIGADGVEPLASSRHHAQTVGVQRSAGASSARHRHRCAARRLTRGIGAQRSPSRAILGGVF